MRHREIDDYDDGGYGQDEYDEYGAEDEGEEEEETAVVEERKPTKEELDFLRLREELKEKFRKELKKENPSSLGLAGRSQDKNRTSNEKFGCFFGPSQPVIAQRVLEESRSIRETQHIAAKVQSSLNNKRNPGSISTYRQTNSQNGKPKVVNEVKKRAQTLKDMRDYSFLLSDDADLPVPEKDQAAPCSRSGPRLDGRSAQAPPKSKMPSSKPVKQFSNGHEFRNSAAAHRPLQTKVRPVKEALVARPKLASSETRKAIHNVVGNESGRPTALTTLPSKVPPKTAGPNRPPMKVTNNPSLEKKNTAKLHSSTPNRYLQHGRVAQGPEVKAATRPPASSSKYVPPKQNPLRDIREERIKKKPVRRQSDDEDEDAIAMIRQMFRYDPGKFAGMDDFDDRDMEVGFDRIQKEERRSSKIAKKEDEEQLRLIEEEERRERMRKKRRLGEH